mmetsp:Transcript_33755/g.89640  ORF Transcript_33755/g.89640 Transcript_33755/m.89640 type:complete len:204 (+) Transcript_33755:3-614(+)
MLLDGPRRRKTAHARAMPSRMRRQTLRRSGSQAAPAAGTVELDEVWHAGHPCGALAARLGPTCCRLVPDDWPELRVFVGEARVDWLGVVAKQLLRSLLNSSEARNCLGTQVVMQHDPHVFFQRSLIEPLQLLLPTLERRVRIANGLELKITHVCAALPCNVDPHAHGRILVPEHVPFWYTFVDNPTHQSAADDVAKASCEPWV